MKTSVAVSVLCATIIGANGFQTSIPRESKTAMKAVDTSEFSTSSAKYSANFKYNDAGISTSDSVRRNEESRKPLSRGTMSAYPRKQKVKELLDQSIVQGGSLRTWTVNTADLVAVEIMTEGRPMDADIELWQGPDNTPQKMKIYSEDGRSRAFKCILEVPRNPSTVAIRNIGYLEFPFQASVKDAIESVPFDGNERTVVQGGALRTFSYQPQVDSVGIYLRTDGRPLTARIEMLQGPNNNKQIMDIYSEDGLERPFFAIVSTPGSGNVVRIVNSSPMEFPLYATVEPMEIGDGIDATYQDGEMIGTQW